MERELGITLPLQVVEALLDLASLPESEPWSEVQIEAFAIAEREIKQVKDMVGRKGGG